MGCTARTGGTAGREQGLTRCHPPAVGVEAVQLTEGERCCEHSPCARLDRFGIGQRVGQQTPHRFGPAAKPHCLVDPTLDAVGVDPRSQRIPVGVSDDVRPRFVGDAGPARQCYPTAPRQCDGAAVHLQPRWPGTDGDVRCIDPGRNCLVGVGIGPRWGPGHLPGLHVEVARSGCRRSGRGRRSCCRPGRRHRRNDRAAQACRRTGCGRSDCREFEIAGRLECVQPCHIVERREMGVANALCGGTRPVAGGDAVALASQHRRGCLCRAECRRRRQVEVVSLPGEAVRLLAHRSCLRAVV